MEENKMIGVMVRLVKLMSAKARRGWLVKMLLEEKGLNFADIGRKHRLTRWYVAGCAKGTHPWSPRIVLALESVLGVMVRELLLPDEAERLKTYEGEGGK